MSLLLHPQFIAYRYLCSFLYPQQLRAESREYKLILDFSSSLLLLRYFSACLVLGATRRT